MYGPEGTLRRRSQSMPVYFRERTYSLSRDGFDIYALQIALRLSGT